MKKILITLFIGYSAIAASAQTMQDVYSFSENVYGGTARSVGLGNAMTAVGGDLGSITINPAGGAVAGYSQMTLTPGLSVSSVRAQGVFADQKDGSKSFGDNVGQNAARVIMPNFGFEFCVDYGRKQGLKNLSFGFLGNATNNYLDDMVARGTNGFTSYAGSMATLAKSWPTGYLFDGNPYFDHDAPWSAIVAYNSFMIDNEPGSEDSYLGVNEKYVDVDGNIGLAGLINQGYGVARHGNKYDYVFNFAGNVSDIFWFGVNLGLVTLLYRESEYWSESAVNTEDFQLVHNGKADRFERLDMDYQYRVDGAGIYGKAGVIVRPVAGLRIGLTAQTPTAMDLRERWSFSGTTDFASTRESASSEEAESKYRLVSPAIFGAGLAYTVGSVALLSVDYEFRDFASMGLREMYREDKGVFDGLNNSIKQSYGVSHAIRAGLEIRPIPVLAIRGGYCYNTSAVKLDGGKMDSFFDKHSFSVGAGYSSPGSFFADLAVRLRRSGERYAPYNYYKYTQYEDGTWSDAQIDKDIACPVIESKSSLVDVIVTLGLRF